MNEMIRQRMERIKKELGEGSFEEPVATSAQVFYACMIAANDILADLETTHLIDESQDDRLIQVAGLIFSRIQIIMQPAITQIPNIPSIPFMPRGGN